MAKIVNHKDQKGFLSMGKKWPNLGAAKNTIREGQKKFTVDDKRTKIKI